MPRARLNGPLLTVLLCTVPGVPAFDITPADCGADERKNPSLCTFWAEVGHPETRALPFASEAERHRAIAALRKGARVTQAADLTAAPPPPPLPEGTIPRCTKTPLPADYLPSAEAMLRLPLLAPEKRCFLPSSRSFLLSFFAAALEADSSDARHLASGELRPGDRASLRFRVCGAAEKASEAAHQETGGDRFFRDVWSAGAPAGARGPGNETATSSTSPAAAAAAAAA
eukprot:CAMPEP_0172606946 /NCGR_PEP_ID=MMETSP1068-20121228/27153_1 /TAXON_ID=35684 /ORGANISM="Pseudopedinella elastica, Strain CCMP716" /LENGTH=228 /DNA_ID=CAMNT_0013409827 /DNA_START=140 /DNA_END=822 /DNA_ORIENTATION=+